MSIKIIYKLDHVLQKHCLYTYIHIQHMYLNYTYDTHYITRTTTLIVCSVNKNALMHSVTMTLCMRYGRQTATVTVRECVGGCVARGCG